MAGVALPRIKHKLFTNGTFEILKIFSVKCWPCIADDVFEDYFFGVQFGHHIFLDVLALSADTLIDGRLEACHELAVSVVED